MIGQLEVWSELNIVEDANMGNRGYCKERIRRALERLMCQAIGMGSGL